MLAVRGADKQTEPVIREIIDDRKLFVEIIVERVDADRAEKVAMQPKFDTG